MPGTPLDVSPVGRSHLGIRPHGQDSDSHLSNC